LQPKHLEGKHVQVHGWAGKDRALEMIEASRERFRAAR
jgi:inorganic pyrophosphatase